MTTTVDTLYAEAMKLDAAQREVLLQRLLAERFDDADADVETAWLEEAERRLAALDRGDTQAVPWPQVRKTLGLA
jgi:hypothetical protein